MGRESSWVQALSCGCWSAICLCHVGTFLGRDREKGRERDIPSEKTRRVELSPPLERRGIKALWNIFKIVMNLFV